jgi:hypothetical protein
MKWLSLAVVLVLCGFLVTGGSGCKKGETPAPKEGEGGKKVTVTPPGATELKPGEKKEVTIKVAREKFDDAVDISFEGGPKGVKAEGGKIEKGKDEGKFYVTADKDAPAGEAEMTVVAKGPGGATDPKTFKVKVTKKD